MPTQFLGTVSNAVAVGNSYFNFTLTTVGTKQAVCHMSPFLSAPLWYNNHTNSVINLYVLRVNTVATWKCKVLVCLRFHLSMISLSITLTELWAFFRFFLAGSYSPQYLPTWPTYAATNLVRLKALLKSIDLGLTELLCQVNSPRTFYVVAAAAAAPQVWTNR